MNIESLVEKLREMGYNAKLLDPLTVNMSDDGSGFCRYVKTDSGYNLVYGGVVVASFEFAEAVLKFERY